MLASTRFAISTTDTGCTPPPSVTRAHLPSGVMSTSSPSLALGLTTARGLTPVRRCCRGGFRLVGADVDLVYELHDLDEVALAQDGFGAAEEPGREHYGEHDSVSGDGREPSMGV